MRGEKKKIKTLKIFEKYLEAWIGRSIGLMNFKQKMIKSEN